MKRKSTVAVILGAILIFALGATLAAYAEPPRIVRNQTTKKASATSTQTKTSASGCAVLPTSQLEKIVGERFGEPQVGKMFPAYSDGASGSTCEFFSKPPFSKGHSTRIDLLIYTEASAAYAKQTFDKVAPFFADSSKPKPGIGDESYWDDTQKKEPKLHVLKGKTHYSIGVEPADEKLILQLASAIAAKL